MNQNTSSSSRNIEDHIVPLHAAIESTKEWRKFCKDFHDEYFIKSFFICRQDLQDLLDNYEQYCPDGVRAYLGLKPEGEYGKKRLQLLLVPAKEKIDFYNCGSSQIYGLEGSSVYDFTMPCPNSCAADSPLNTDDFHKH